MVTMVTCLYPSMIFSVGVSLMGGTIAYYIALAWSTAAIAYFEVSILVIYSLIIAIVTSIGTIRMSTVYVAYYIIIKNHHGYLIPAMITGTDLEITGTT